jgi:hypothetical protein
MSRARSSARRGVQYFYPPSFICCALPASCVACCIACRRAADATLALPRWFRLEKRIGTCPVHHVI